MCTSLNCRRTMASKLKIIKYVKLQIILGHSSNKIEGIPTVPLIQF